MQRTSMSHHAIIKAENNARVGRAMASVTMGLRRFRFQAHAVLPGAIGIDLSGIERGHFRGRSVCQKAAEMPSLGAIVHFLHFRCHR
jgi:hypothetical protein